MAERWQQWMPFHIDKFRGSPEVQAMHPAGRMGYLYLLASAWQTDDCSISADPMDLATESGLGDELWALYGPRILRKFHAIDGGRLRNEVVFEEWSETKRVWEEKQMTPEERAALAIKRSAAGIAGNEKRWSMHRKTKQVATDVSQNIATCDESNGKGIAKDRLTGTGTGTETTTEPLSTKPLASTALAVPASPIAFTIYLTSGKTHLVTEAEVVRAEKAFPAVDVRQELRTMVEWLDAHPEKRSHSPKGAKSRIVNWMSAKQDKGGSKNGNTQGKPTRFDTIAESSRAALAILDGVDNGQNRNVRSLDSGGAPRSIFESADDSLVAQDSGGNRGTAVR